MKRIALPQPPNADDPSFKGNQLAFNRAVTAYFQRMRGLLEDASRINDTPLGQQFVVTSFTTNTTLTGTDTLGDVADFVCSLVAAFHQKGIVSQKISRSDPT